MFADAEDMVAELIILTMIAQNEVSIPLSHKLPMISFDDDSLTIPLVGFYCDRRYHIE